jgi:hypothetical protein
VIPNRNLKHNELNKIYVWTLYMIVYQYIFFKREKRRDRDACSLNSQRKCKHETLRKCLETSKKLEEMKDCYTCEISKLILYSLRFKI